MSKKQILIFQIIVMILISIGSGYIAGKLGDSLLSALFAAICILIWIPIFGTAIMADTEEEE